MSEPRKRRQEDRCIAKRVYNAATPYIQLLGWAAVAIPIMLGGYALADKALAFDARLTELEQAQRSTASDIRSIRDKQDLMIDFFGIKRR